MYNETMYNELIKNLRVAGDFVSLSGYQRDLMRKAADVIEGLSRECKVLYAMLGTHPDPRGELGDPGMLPEPPKEEE
jgi:hypothetical protein